MVTSSGFWLVWDHDTASVTTDKRASAAEWMVLSVMLLFGYVRFVFAVCALVCSCWWQGSASTEAPARGDGQGSRRRARARPSGSGDVVIALVPSAGECSAALGDERLALLLRREQRAVGVAVTTAAAGLVPLVRPRLADASDLLFDRYLRRGGRVLRPALREVVRARDGRGPRHPRRQHRRCCLQENEPRRRGKRQRTRCS